MSEDKLTANEVLQQIISTKKVTAADVKILSDKVKENWKIDLNEAEILFKVNKSIGDACPEWTEFFVNSISQLIVMDMNTPGEIDSPEGDRRRTCFRPTTLVTRHRIGSVSYTHLTLPTILLV